MLFFTAFFSVAMGCFIGIVGQERRAKIWFLLLCTSTASGIVTLTGLEGARR